MFNIPVIILKKIVLLPNQEIKLELSNELIFSVKIIVIMYDYNEKSRKVVRALLKSLPYNLAIPLMIKDRKEFYVLKFRSMRVDAEKDGVARLSTGDNDDRITPVGKVIRKFRLDELPQLINILEGSMSIVGPRPERPEIAEQYEKELPEFALRLQAKAGLTGYAQVYGKYNTEPYDKLMMDLMYISNPSFTEDLKIMFATIKVLFEPESTDGVDEGKTTAIK